MISFARRGVTGVLLNIRLSPGASRNQIMGIGFDNAGNPSVKISVTAVPEKGKANSALMKLLAKLLKRPQSDFEIVAGRLDRNKTVLIAGDPAHIEAELAQKIDIVLGDKGA